MKDLKFPELSVLLTTLRQNYPKEGQKQKAVR